LIILDVGVDCRGRVPEVSSGEVGEVVRAWASIVVNMADSNSNGVRLVLWCCYCRVSGDYKVDKAERATQVSVWCSL
jgi:hypothetical protein